LRIFRKLKSVDAILLNSRSNHHAELAALVKINTFTSLINAKQNKIIDIYRQRKLFKSNQILLIVVNYPNVLQKIFSGSIRGHNFEPE
jgi:hypothetical protein